MYCTRIVTRSLGADEVHADSAAVFCDDLGAVPEAVFSAQYVQRLPDVGADHAHAVLRGGACTILRLELGLVTWWQAFEFGSSDLARTVVGPSSSAEKAVGVPSAASKCSFVSSSHVPQPFTGLQCTLSADHEVFQKKVLLPRRRMRCNTPRADPQGNVAVRTPNPRGP